MIKLFLVFSFFYILIFTGITLVSAAHYVVGIVNDANDGTLANGHTVVLWNSLGGINDNLTDIIGVNGNSGIDNVYMIDCELLNTSCNIGNVLNLRVLNNGDNHSSSNVSVNVSGGGYDISPNMTLSSIFNILNISVDDDIPSPLNEIDLFAGINRSVSCIAVIENFDGVGIKNATAKFFDNASSFYLDLDNGNKHYSNNSCYINSSYGINQSQILCNFQIAYYANSSTWRCTLSIRDNNNISKNGFNHTFINSLLSIEVNGVLDYGVFGVYSVSPEKIINVTNHGNVRINLSLYGYAANPGDDLAMNCSNSRNISIMYEKYNLTASNPGNLNLMGFESKYTNLTGNSAVKNFNLDFRHNDTTNFAVNSTYWRIYAPSGISGSCSGNIIFGASQSTGS